ncbi:MAG: rhomboid family intramembrane serine protease [Janthinobacterium lividum]
MSQDPAIATPLIDTQAIVKPTVLSSEKPIVTPILIALNVLVFIAMLVGGLSPFDPTAEQVLRWGANFGPLTESGQWWRLFTACFLHFGIVHIGFNMYVLYQIGFFTERLFRGPRYLALYLVAGLGGNLIGLVLHPNVVAAGASGAIFGVYGGLLAYLLRYRGVANPQAAKAVTRSVFIFLGYNLLYGLADRHTDLTAHIGGLATGFLAGLVLAPKPGSLRKVI